MQGETESLFDEMYELTLNPTTETRTRTVTKTGTRTVTNADGTTSTETYTYEEEEEYTVTILEVTLTAKDLNVVAAGHMDSEQKEIYALYNETHGLTQQFYTPAEPVLVQLCEQLLRLPHQSGNRGGTAPQGR